MTPRPPPVRWAAGVLTSSRPGHIVRERVSSGDAHGTEETVAWLLAAGPDVARTASGSPSSDIRWASQRELIRTPQSAALANGMFSGQLPHGKAEGRTVAVLHSHTSSLMSSPCTPLRQHAPAWETPFRRRLVGEVAVVARSTISSGTGQVAASSDPPPRPVHHATAIGPGLGPAPAIGRRVEPADHDSDLPPAPTGTAPGPPAAFPCELGVLGPGSAGGDRKRGEGAQPWLRWTGPGRRRRARSGPHRGSSGR